MTPLFSALLGACIGSFLNVCLFRWKKREHIFFPSSFCPHCEKPLLWRDNIPVLSFFLLKGKCRFCHRLISRQYPLIELISMLAFYLSAIFFKKEPFFLISSFFFTSFLILLSTSDIKWRLLPHSFNNFFILIGFFFIGIRSFFSFQSFFEGASSFFVIGSFMFVFTQIFPKGLGGGDVKMTASFAPWVGVSKTLYILLFAFGIGSFFAIILLMMGRITRKSMIPFGPFLALGALVVWFWPKFIHDLRIAP